MSTNTGESAVCLILTATVRVEAGMQFTARMNTDERLADYLKAFALWMAQTHVRSVLFIENSGYDLQIFRSIAQEHPNKHVEFVSFICQPFDGSLGKGYGEMIILQEALRRSTLLRACSHFVKVSGRYFIHNLGSLIQLPIARPDLDVICNFIKHLTYSDSRAFGGSVLFLEHYLCPLQAQCNDAGRRALRKCACQGRAPRHG